ncbi:MAG: monovalent cation/H(+) antiporter subunit G [Anaerolineae bacterium]|nr:monovalent cation/H(+) antiporter subunit G [Anaerolineae bacterium]
MTDIITLILMIIGAFFMFVGALGLLRLPDLFMRMSATTKSATFGVGFMLLAAAVYFNDVGVASRMLATIAFLFLTAPVAAHMIARAAYMRQLQLWHGTSADELAGRYDLEGNRLTSTPPKLHGKLLQPKTPTEAGD